MPIAEVAVCAAYVCLCTCGMWMVRVCAWSLLGSSSFLCGFARCRNLFGTIAPLPVLKPWAKQCPADMCVGTNTNGIVIIQGLDQRWTGMEYNRHYELQHRSWWRWSGWYNVSRYYHTLMPRWLTSIMRSLFGNTQWRLWIPCHRCEFSSKCLKCVKESVNRIKEGYAAHNPGNITFWEVVWCCLKFGHVSLLLNDLS